VVVLDVADAVSSSIESIPLDDPTRRSHSTIPLDDLGARAGRIRGRGYVDGAEAASELVTEAMESFRADLRRRAGRGLTDAAAQLAAGMVAGLHRLREPQDGTVLAYAGPDTPSELAAEVMRDADRLGVALPAEGGRRYWPRWPELDRSEIAARVFGGHGSGRRSLVETPPRRRPGSATVAPTRRAGWRSAALRVR
jgi:hypothetical protein